MQVSQLKELQALRFGTDLHAKRSRSGHGKRTNGSLGGETLAKCLSIKKEAMHRETIELADASQVSAVSKNTVCPYD